MRTCLGFSQKSIGIIKRGLQKSGLFFLINGQKEYQPADHYYVYSIYSIDILHSGQVTAIHVKISIRRYHLRISFSSAMIWYWTMLLVVFNGTGTMQSCDCPTHSEATLILKCMGEKISWIRKLPLWHHQMETFSALLTFCVRTSPVTGEFHSQRSVTRS